MKGNNETKNKRREHLEKARFFQNMSVDEQDKLIKEFNLQLKKEMYEEFSNITSSDRISKEEFLKMSQDEKFKYMRDCEKVENTKIIRQMIVIHHENVKGMRQLLVGVVIMFSIVVVYSAVKIILNL